MIVYQRTQIYGTYVHLKRFFMKNCDKTVKLEKLLAINITMCYTPITAYVESAGSKAS